MDQLFWAALNSEDEQSERVAWKQVYQSAIDNTLTCSRNDLVQLVQRFSEVMQQPHPEPLRESALRAMIAVAALPPAPPTALASDPQTDDQVHRLDQWFWRPMQVHNAAVFRATQGNRHRDGDAVIDLARRIGRRHLDNVQIVPIPLEDPKWDAKLDFPEAVCLMGRLGIWGRKAVQEFSTTNTRYYFPDVDRPKLEPDQLDTESWHQILERRLGDDPRIRVPGSSNDNIRTDYAVIQRYFQELTGANRRGRHVYLFAGCTTLGTFGTVSILDSFQDIGLPKGAPPHSISESSTLEVLIKVEQSNTWTPKSSISRLLIDDRWEWHKSDSTWTRRTPDKIVIAYDESGPKEIHVDDMTGPKVFQDGGEVVQLIDAIREATNGQPLSNVKHDVLIRDGTYKKYSSRIHDKLGRFLSTNDDRTVFTLEVPIEICQTP